LEYTVLKDHHQTATTKSLPDKVFCIALGLDEV